MTNATHTPWRKTGLDSSYFGMHTIEREDGSGFAATCTDDEARLIAAAPELLEALKSAEGILSLAGYAEWPGGSLAEIRAAIAKAVQS